MPLLKCLQPQIDSSCIHSAVSLFPPSQSPDPLALEAELQVLSELLPTDVGKDYSKVVELSEANKSTLPLANSAVRLMLTAPVTVASNERSFSKLKFVLFFTFDIKYYQLSVLYIQETTMNSHKVEINKSFALWKKSRHIKLFLLGNFGLQHPPPPVRTLSQRP